MKLLFTFSFFIFLNFLLMVIPKLMPNVISIERMIFWLVWINGLFVFTLILPTKASYIFEESSSGIMKIMQDKFK